LLQRPHRTLARGAATEIRTSDEDLGIPVGLAIEDEVRVFRSVGQITQRAKGPFAERTADRSTDQALDADDHVGIDIAAHDRGRDRAESVEGFRHLNALWPAHPRSPPISRPQPPSPGWQDGFGRAALACR